MFRFLFSLVLLPCLHVQAAITADTAWSGTVESTTETIADGILTIRPGTRLTDVDITVTGAGAVRAAGTPDSIIVFDRSVVTFDGITRDSLNVFTHCLFQNRFNLVEFRTAADVREPSAPSFTDCVFRHGGYALVYITSGGAPRFTRCTFYNAGSGIFLHGGSRVSVDYCTIYGTSCGIINATIDGWYQHLTVSHCTIYGITGTRSYDWANGFGITNGNQPGTLAVTNTIIAHTDRYGLHNGLQPWQVNADWNCYFDNGSGAADLPTGVHSLVDTDPRFTDTTGGFFGLNDDSPCVNAASDGLHTGAWQGVPTGINQDAPLPDGHRRLSINPQPVTHSANIHLPAAGYDRSITVLTGQGVTCATLTITAGTERIHWNGMTDHSTSLPAGLYILRSGTDAVRFLKR